MQAILLALGATQAENKGAANPENMLGKKSPIHSEQGSE